MCHEKMTPLGECKSKSCVGGVLTPVKAAPKLTCNATHFCSNPNLLLDRNSRVVWMVYYQCLVAEVYRHCIPVMTSSKDNGVTWSSGKVIDGEN